MHFVRAISFKCTHIFMEENTCEESKASFGHSIIVNGGLFVLIYLHVVFVNFCQVLLWCTQFFSSFFLL